jgi:hypothetical protein
MTPGKCSSGNPAERARLLISQLVDGELSAEDATELNGLIRADARRLEDVVDQLLLDCLLTDEMGPHLLGGAVDLAVCSSEGDKGEFSGESPEAAIPERPFDQPSRLRSRSAHVEAPDAENSNGETARTVWRRLRAGLVGVVLAAIVLLTALNAWLWWARQSMPEHRAIAWVNRGDRAVPLFPGDHVRRSSGDTVLRFVNGVAVSLEGKADLELISAMKVRLHSGQIQTDVGEAGRGFTVLTDSADVVDLGTVFGVGVTPSQETNVVVFDGVIDVDSRKGARKNRLVAMGNLTTGEAIKIQPDGKHTRIPAIWQSVAGTRWSTDRASEETSIIAGVRDNLSTKSRPKYYGIVLGGFREDAKVYVDRPYEWNGLTRAGLPAELIGADYIRTFCDDKFCRNLEIVVTLAGPADVYVLIDKRLRAPDWLATDFVDTGMEVGVDYGDKYETQKHAVPPLGKQAKRWLGVGPGRSVDVPFSVWKREVRDSREVRLGPVRERPSAEDPFGIMYGIVVVPAATE